MYGYALRVTYFISKCNGCVASRALHIRSLLMIFKCDCISSDVFFSFLIFLSCIFASNNPWHCLPPPPPPFCPILSGNAYGLPSTMAECTFKCIASAHCQFRQTVYWKFWFGFELSQCQAR